MVITHLSFEVLSSQMSHIRKGTTSKTSCSQAQLKAALDAVRSGRKIWEIGRQFDVHDDTLTQGLKLNLTGRSKIGGTFTEEQERKLWGHMLQLSDMF
jgi:hypothetical protein